MRNPILAHSFKCHVTGRVVHFPACASGPAKTHKDRANKKVYTHSLRLLEDFHALCNLIDYSNSNDPDSSVVRFPGGGERGLPYLTLRGSS